MVTADRGDGHDEGPRIGDGRGLRIDDVRVSFGDVRAVDGVDLAVPPGRVLALVGPSGCGKSTLLRYTAGLEAGRGRVRWDGADLTATRPDRRFFGLMFQDHALFPNRTVAGNVAFGLRMAGMGGAERRARVGEMLDLVGLAGRGDRAVDTLSGGEAQRVALARALAPSPRLLMLDEPLGSLDRELRERLAADLREILTGAGVAAILVTHDQEEAYAVADDLAVMRAGRIVRRGTTRAVWSDPATVFTARFLGHRNVLTPEALASLGLEVAVRSADSGTHGFDAPTAAGVPGGGPAHAVIPEAALQLFDEGERSAWPTHTARVDEVRFRGPISRVDLVLEAPGEPVRLRLHTPRPPEPGRPVRVAVDPDGIRPLLDDT